MNSSLDIWPLKMTKSIGNFSGRPWVLKKWTVKMKPVASSASSEWTMVATLNAQPGRKHAEEFGEPEHQAGTADGEHTPEDRDEVELFPVGPALEGRLRPLEEEPSHHADDIADIAQVGAERVRTEQPLQRVALDILPDEEEVDAHDDGRWRNRRR